jgi:hypothetical protein
MAFIQTMTKDDLVDAIRKATALDDLTELKRWVSPSDEMIREAEKRLQKLDKIADACDWGNMFPDHRAQLYRDRWHRIMAEQSAFESEYC